MKIALVTCPELSEGTADDRILRDAFLQDNHAVQFEVWSNSRVRWQEYDVILIRSTWDYHRHLSRFLTWAQEASKQSRLVNPWQVVAWNASKKYLLELLDHGVSVVHTEVASDADHAVEYARRLLQLHPAIVIKPAVSATAESLFRVTNLADARDAIQAALTTGDVVIQPYLSSIAEDGELSLIFFCLTEWRFSHAVHKLPRLGDFRVQSNFGGTANAVEPSDAIVRFSEEALSCVPPEAIFARVDIVDWKTDPKIGELELIEPDLFFRDCKDSSDKLQAALIHHVTSGRASAAAHRS